MKEIWSICQLKTLTLLLVYWKPSSVILANHCWHMSFMMKLFSFWVRRTLKMIKSPQISIRTVFLDWPKEERSRNVKMILREKLPIENYELFKYVVEFLVQVSQSEFILSTWLQLHFFRSWIVRTLIKWHLQTSRSSSAPTWSGRKVIKCRLQRSDPSMLLSISSSKITMTFIFSISIKRTLWGINRGFCRASAAGVEIRDRM